MAARDRLKKWWRYARGFVTGVALSWLAAPVMLRRRAALEHLFALNLLLESKGLPVLPPKRRAFLLPHMVPLIMGWQRRLRLWDDSLDAVDLKHIGH